MMKSLPVILSLLLSSMIVAQTPGVQWANRIFPATSALEGQVLNAITPVKAGGFIMAGADKVGLQFTPMLLDKEDIATPVLIRTDSIGNVTWFKTAPASSGSGVYNSVIIANNNEIVTAGFSNRPQLPMFGIAHDVTFSRYTANGAFIAEKTYGGLDADFGQSIIQDKQQYFVIAGYTRSKDSLVTGNHASGTYDFWVIKLDTAGSLIWQKCYGSSADDKAFAVKATADGGYIVAGYNSANNGNVTGNRGGQDGWLVKLDRNGNVEWQRSVGGSANDGFRSVQQMPDGGYLACGYTFSNDKDVIGNHGGGDAWIVRLTATGSIAWQKCYGGTAEESFSEVQTAPDKSFVATGFASSVNGDVTELKGGADIWMCNLSTSGNLVWQKTMGTIANEYAMGGLILSETSFLVAGIVNPFVGSFGGPELLPKSWLYKSGNSGFISGKVFIDNNRNGIKDPGELPFSNAIVRSQKPGYQRASIPYGGLFYTDVDTGTYKTTITIYNQPYYTVAPVTFTSTIPTYFARDSMSFALQPVAGKRDLAVVLIPTSPSRPGFTNTYQVYYSNQGTDTLSSGTIRFIKNSKLELKSASPAPAISKTGDTLSWNFTNLKPFDTASIMIICRLDSSISPLSNDTLHLVAEILPIANDLTPANNISVLRQHVTGSFDPNDKTEIHGGSLRPGQVSEGEYLTYTIRFQNTGTDTAFNISVRDTLDGKLDWSTLQMITSSHPYQLAVTEANRLNWQFNNIHLVDSFHNEPLSHGYIVYRIKPLSTFRLGDTIKNRASIYFDFNLPVLTNTEQTVVQALALPLKLTSFTASTKGNKNVLAWSTSNELNVQLFMVERSSNGSDFFTLGKIQPGNQGNYSFIDDTPAPVKNFYRLKMLDIDGQFTYSPIRVLESRLSVSMNVYPNPAKDVLVVQLNSGPEVVSMLDIIEATGKVVKRLEVNAAGRIARQLNVSALATGTYFVRAKTAAGYSTMPFDKQ